MQHLKKLRVFQGPRLHYGYKSKNHFVNNKT